MANVTATVSLPGQGKVDVTVKKGSTIADAVAAAAAQLGVGTAPNLAGLGVVADSKEAKASDVVEDGTKVAVAPKVANG